MPEAIKAKPLTEMKFGNEPITSPKVHKGSYVTFNAGKYEVTLFREGTSVVIEKRPCADDPTKKAAQDTASYDSNGELAGVVLAERAPYFPGGVFKIVGADGSYKVINPEAEIGDYLAVVRAKGVVTWRAFKGLEQQLRELRGHPAVRQSLHGGQSQ